MGDAFQFCASAKLVEITGRRARDLEELLAGVRELDGSVIFHHTHHFLFQHQYWLPEPASDFAWWVTEVLREHALGEELASISTIEFRSIHELRARIVAALEGHLARESRRAHAPRGLEFNFLRASTFVFPTRHRASTLAEFAACLERASLSSIYHHVFEARLRLERPTNDFARWFRESLGDARLAEEVERLDPYVYTLEDLRAQILRAVRRRL